MSLLLLLCQCAPSPRTSNLAASVQLLADHRDIPTHPFLYEILGNLKPALRVQNTFSITVIENEQPIAASVQNGQIILSSGLLKNLTTEASLAFVIAHELGHFKLGHFNSESDPTHETDADALALWGVYRAGYNPSSAAEALNLVYDHSFSDAAYPDPQKRKEAVRALLHQMRQDFPGIIDTHSAKNFRKSLW